MAVSPPTDVAYAGHAVRLVVPRSASRLSEGISAARSVPKAWLINGSLALLVAAACSLLVHQRADSRGVWILGSVAAMTFGVFRLTLHMHSAIAFATSLIFSIHPYLIHVLTAGDARETVGVVLLPLALGVAVLGWQRRGHSLGWLGGVVLGVAGFLVGLPALLFAATAPLLGRMDAVRSPATSASRRVSSRRSASWLVSVFGSYGITALLHGPDSSSTAASVNLLQWLDRNDVLRPALAVLAEEAAVDAGAWYVGWSLLALGVGLTFAAITREAHKNSKAASALFVAFIVLAWFTSGHQSMHRLITEVFESCTVRHYVEPKDLQAVGVSLLAVAGLAVCALVHVSLLIRRTVRTGVWAILGAAALAIAAWSYAPTDLFAGVGGMYSIGNVALLRSAAVLCLVGTIGLGLTTLQKKWTPWQTIIMAGGVMALVLIDLWPYRFG